MAKEFDINNSRKEFLIFYGACFRPSRLARLYDSQGMSAAVYHRTLSGTPPMYYYIAVFELNPQARSQVSQGDIFVLSTLLPQRQDILAFEYYVSFVVKPAYG